MKCNHICILQTIFKLVKGCYKIYIRRRKCPLYSEDEQKEQNNNYEKREQEKKLKVPNKKVSDYPNSYSDDSECPGSNDCTNILCVDEEYNANCKSYAECSVDGKNIAIAVVANDYLEETEYTIKDMDTNTILIYNNLSYHNNTNHTSTICFKQIDTNSPFTILKNIVFVR